LIAATTDLWPRDQVRVFGMSRYIDQTTGKPTRWFFEAQTFRIEGQMVLRNVGGNFSRYENCTVFGLKNWSCSYKDGSGWFSMVNGDYVESEMNSDIFPGYERRTISEFTYHLERCTSLAHDGVSVFFHRRVSQSSSSFAASEIALARATFLDLVRSEIAIRGLL
jgi:hypothetical protein